MPLHRPPSVAAGHCRRLLSLCALALACVAVLGAVMPAVSVARVGRCHRHHHRHRRCRRHRRRRAASANAGSITAGATTAGSSSAATSSPCANATTPATSATTDAVKAAVLCLVNQQRTARGLPVLSNQSQLDGSAQQWSNWMVGAGQFTHGTNLAARILVTGYNFKIAGENIATGAPTPASVVKAWMASTDHCKNILSPAYRDVGTGVNPNPVPGVAASPATWTQDFGLLMSAAQPSQNWAPARGCPY